ncbi:MAG: ATP-binding protein [Candidatus Paceibacterota bacterium]
MPDNQFQFQFSLEVLNHLGRGLYRSFATVIAEAVSNAWDAEATEVKITINSEGLIIEDNGKGMNSSDFQGRFLNVGYSRRDDVHNKSKRNVIGRKGIGKLAMLSISEKVVIISKKQGNEMTGGKINNSVLDNEIKNDGKYTLGNLTDNEKINLYGKPTTQKTGTKIIFEKIKINLNSEDIIRKYLATQFNFIFSIKRSDSFVIKVNDKPITTGDLKELNDNTQFAWYLEKKDKSFSNRFKNIKNERLIQDTIFTFEGKTITIRGFVGSISKSNQLLLKGSKGDFKASVNLFTNGRLRQENLFDEITKKTVTEEYLYGEIHVDGFEDDQNDRFTSSREGIIKDDPLYQEFLKKLEKILAVIIQDWTPWRRAIKEDVDIEQDKRPGYEVRMEESRNKREKDFRDKINENVGDKKIKKSLQDKLKHFSYKNTLVYQDLYILENIFREYLKNKGVKETDFDVLNADEKNVLDRINKIKSLRKTGEAKHSLKGKIVKQEHYLNYTDLCDLGEIVDIFKAKGQKKPLPRKYQYSLISDAQEINPVRNPVMHTNEITDEVMAWAKIKNLIDYIEKLK